MRIVIQVQNLKCGGCSKTILTDLEKMDGVSEIDINIEASTISFYCEEREAVSLVKNTLKSIGYPSINDENGVLTKAKSYISCGAGKLLEKL